MTTLRTMYMQDLPKVIDIINAHDEDDAECAEQQYHELGFDNQFVLELDDKVIGVTGYQGIEATDNSYWLSWTYLAPELQGKGLGKEMLESLIDKLKQQNARKLFVKVSDYIDEDGNDLYQNAHKLYQSLDFKLEVTNHDFYDEAENQLILSLTLLPEEETEQTVAEEKPNMKFNGLYEIEETDGAFSFSWEVIEKFSLFGKKTFTAQDLRLGLETVKNRNGRKVFLTFPSNLPLIHGPLQGSGFKYVGQLTDYYEHGVHELHFSHDLQL